MENELYGYQRSLFARERFDQRCIPVPKRTFVARLNVYRPVALTSVLMRTFERLVLNYIKRQIPADMDPLQFAYRQNTTVEDTISFALNGVYEHFDYGNCQARMPLKLFHKLITLGLSDAICKWILNS